MLLEYVLYMPFDISTIPNIMGGALESGFVSWSPASCKALGTVKLGETTIISRKEQLLALQNVDQCSRELDSSVARNPASSNL